MVLSSLMDWSEHIFFIWCWQVEQEMGGQSIHDPLYRYLACQFLSSASLAALEAVLSLFHWPNNWPTLVAWGQAKFPSTMTKFALENWISKLTQEHDELINDFYNWWGSFKQVPKQASLQYKNVNEFAAKLKKKVFVLTSKPMLTKKNPRSGPCVLFELHWLPSIRTVGTVLIVALSCPSLKDLMVPPRKLNETIWRRLKTRSVGNVTKWVISLEAWEAVVPWEGDGWNNKVSWVKEGREEKEIQKLSSR